MFGIFNKKHPVLAQVKLQEKSWEIPDFDQMVAEERQKGNLMTLSQSIDFIGKSDFFQLIMPTDYASKHHNKSMFLTDQEVNQTFQADAELKETHWKNFITICGLFGIYYKEGVAEKFKFPTPQTKSEFYNSNRNLYICITRIIDSLALLQGKRIAFRFVSFLVQEGNTARLLSRDAQKAIKEHWEPRIRQLSAELEKINGAPLAAKPVPLATGHEPLEAVVLRNPAQPGDIICRKLPTRIESDILTSEDADAQAGAHDLATYLEKERDADFFNAARQEILNSLAQPPRDEYQIAPQPRYYDY